MILVLDFESSHTVIFAVPNVAIVRVQFGHMLGEISHLVFGR